MVNWKKVLSIATPIGAWLALGAKSALGGRGRPKRKLNRKKPKRKNKRY